MKILYISQTGNTGYTLSAREYMLALSDLGVKVQWLPTRWSLSGATPTDRDACHPDLAHLLTDIGDPDRVLVHLVPTEHNSRLPLDRAPVVSYTTWETDRIPKTFLPPLEASRKVLVPSSWNRRVFQDSGLSTPVEVVPHLLEPEMEGLEATFSAEVFTFYSVGPWTDRKALSLIVEAFCRAFTAKDRVRLILKTTRKDCTKHSQTWGLRHLLDRYNTSQRAVERIKIRFPNPAPIHLIHGDLDRTEMLDLHRQFHCYVLLSRGEGWALGCFEAAAAGVPVIATNYGGHLDYLRPEESFLVDYDLRPCRVSCWEAQFTPDQNWAEPRLDHAVAQMQAVFQNSSRAREKARSQSERIQSDYRREVVAARFLDSLLNI